MMAYISMAYLVHLCIQVISIETLSNENHTLLLVFLTQSLSILEPFISSRLGALFYQAYFIGLNRS